MNHNNINPKRVLIIRAGRLGDTVWGTTAIEPIRAFLGEQTRIDMVVARGMRALFESDPRIETIFEIDHRNIPLPFSPAKLAVLFKSLQYPYDIVVNLEMSSHFVSLMRHIRASLKVHAAHVPAEQSSEKRHYVDSVRYTLSQGIPSIHCQDAAPSLRFSQYIDTESLIGNNRDYICLHPGNSLLARGKSAVRSWPEYHWRELAKQISHHLPDLQIVLIGEKSERALSEAVSADIPQITNLVGRTSLQQLMAVLANSRVLVTTDTGPAHVAAALATPVIAIFGPSDALNTGPFASKDNWATAVLKNIGCNPCVDSERSETCIDNKCMQAVAPTDILSIIDMALHKQPVPPVMVLNQKTS